MCKMSWAIGLFEGEGSIVTNRYGRSKHGQVVLTIQVTDKDILQRFYNIVKVGNLRGPYNNKGPNTHKGQIYKKVWVWSCGTSVDVIKLLTRWLPLLGKRRKQKAKEAIKLANKSIAWMRKKNQCCKNGHRWSHFALTALDGTRRCKACLSSWYNKRKLRKE